MSRTLILLRHGKSDWSTGDEDYDRPLKKRGRNASSKVGKWLHDKMLVPDFVITSSAKRAVQTAELACKSMGIRIQDIYKQKHIYLATPEDLLHVLKDCPEQAKRVMLVGHNPGLEQLLYFLVGGNITIPEDGKILPTAAVAQLVMPDCWGNLDTGSAELASLVRPRDITG